MRAVGVCATATNNTPKWRTFLDWFGYFQSIKILWGIFLGLLAAIGVVLRMPPSPLTYLIAAATFTGTWAVFGTLAWAGGKAVPAIRRRRNPHFVTIELAVGEIVELVLRHHGEPAVWRADAVIVSTIDKGVNPHPTPFGCRIHKGTSSNTRMTMADGEWGTITLATVARTEWRSANSWLSIYRHQDDGIAVPDSGIVLQLTLNATPASKWGPLVKTLEIRRNESGDLIAAPLRH
ncbi:MAG: hypothetical protein WA655_11575 [Candidatus Korobacteraceae bacterium]